MIIGICGKSGSGKDFIVGRMKEAFGVLEMKSYTTRAMRPGEVEGAKYHFVSVDAFQKIVQDGKFIEFVEYGGTFYGTTKEEVQQAIASDATYVMIATPSGLNEIEQSLEQGHLVRIYIDVDESIRDKRFITRLNGKETDQDYQALAKRKAQDDLTFAGAKEQCDMVIDNSKEFKSNDELDHLIETILNTATDIQQRLDDEKGFDNV